MTTTDTTTTKHQPDLTTAPDQKEDPSKEAISPTDIGVHIPVGSLVPNPANPRKELGDLTEMVRSVKTHGILQPLLVLPAAKNSEHLIVAGHRRHAAAQQAGITTVPVVIRKLDQTEVLEVMLIENGSREDLTLAEEINTLEALMALNTGYTPRKLCNRIGKSQRWIKDRLAVTILPTKWRDQLDTGELTLAEAVAASTLADLGPEHIDNMCEQLVAGTGWRDPATDVDMYRKDLQTREAADALIDKLTGKGITVYGPEFLVPDAARSLQNLRFSPEQVKAHETEPCHAVEVRPGYNAGPQLTHYCCIPKRHRETKQKAAESEIIAPPPQGRSQTEAADQASRRKGRVARLAAGTELFGRSSKKPRADDLRDLTLSTLIATANTGSQKHALKILGINPVDDQSPTDLLKAVAAESHQALVRVAGAVACGTAEDAAYYSTSDTVIDYMCLLIRNGWEPDDLTANILVRHKG